MYSYVTLESLFSKSGHRTISHVIDAFIIGASIREEQGWDMWTNTHVLSVIDSLKYGYTRESNRFETVQMDEIAESGSLQLCVFTILIKRTNSHTST